MEISKPLVENSKPYQVSRVCCMKRIIAVVVGGLLMLATGCTKTVYVASTDAPSTDAPSTDAPSTDAPTTDGTPTTEAPAPIDYDNGDIFKHSRVEEACGMVRDLQPPNGNNSDAVLVYLTDLAEAIWEATLQNAQYGLPKSKYEEFGTNLKVSLMTFNEREQQYFPITHSMALDNCESFGW